MTAAPLRLSTLRVSPVSVLRMPDDWNGSTAPSTLSPFGARRAQR
jgi:hypothetical protein